MMKGLGRVLCAFSLLWLALCPALANSATSALPAFFDPGQTFTVSIAVACDAGVRVQAFEETPPAGWAVTSVSHGGSVDPISGKVKWGPFTDALARSLTYQITPPVGAVGTHGFSGVAVFDSQMIPIAGGRATKRFPGSVNRTMPANYLPGGAIDIALTVTPAADVYAWAGEELVPAGWTVSSIGEAGSYDAVNRKIKWGPFFDTSARALAYTIAAPLSARGDAEFSATIRLDEAQIVRPGTVPIVASAFTRSVPATYQPGVSFEVALVANAAPFVQMVTLEEKVPAGWTPLGRSSGGVWDATNRKIKWGPIFGGGGTFRYSLTPSANESAPLILSAVAVFDEITLASEQTILRHRVRSENSLVRTLPAHYRPGEALTLMLLATPAEMTLVYALEESVPVGWTVGAISHGGIFDGSNHKIKWGPFFDAATTVRTLTCALTPPVNAFGAVAFAGLGFFDTENISTAGPAELGHAPPAIARSMPARYNAGQGIPISLAAAPVPGVVTYAVEEAVPNGWVVSGISDGGAYDAANKKVKWGPFVDRNIRSLTYTATPAPVATGSNTFTGQGLFNLDAVAVSGRSIVAENHPPVAAADLFSRPVSSSFKVSVFRLLANDSDVDGDALQVISVSAHSTQGGSLVMEWPWIYYTPPPGLPAADTFSYTVRDAFNATAVSTVTLNPAPPVGGPAQNVIDLETLVGGAVRVRFSGVPSFTYHIQTSDDLADWQPAADRVANSVGVFEFTDGSAGASPTRFYRTLWP